MLCFLEHLLTILAITQVIITEHDIEAMEVYRFQSWRHDRISEIGTVVERAVPELEGGKGFEILYRLQLIAAGMEIAANPRGPAALDRNDPDLSGLWVNLEEELESMVLALIR